MTYGTLKDLEKDLNRSRMSNKRFLVILTVVVTVLLITTAVIGNMWADAIIAQYTMKDKP